MLEWIFFTIGMAVIFSGAVFALCAFRAHKLKLFSLMTPLIAIALLLGIFGLMQIFWAFSAPGKDVSQLFLVNTVLYGILAYFFSTLFLQMRKGAYLMTLRWMFLAALLIALIGFDFALHTISAISASFLLLSSMSLVRNAKDHFFLIGVSCSLCALFTLISIILFISFGSLALAYFLAPFFLVICALSFHEHLLCCKYELKNEKNKGPFVFVFARSLLFICVLVIFAFMITFQVHELGHAIAAQAMGCADARIIFTLQDYPFTETNCTFSNPDLIYWAGVAATTFVGLFLLFLREKFVRSIGILTIGLGFLFVYDDLSQLKMTSFVFTLFLISSFFLIVWGIVRLAIFSYSINNSIKNQKFSCATCSIN